MTSSLSCKLVSAALLLAPILGAFAAAAAVRAAVPVKLSGSAAPSSYTQRVSGTPVSVRLKGGDLNASARAKSFDFALPIQVPVSAPENCQRYSQPFARAMREASTRFAAPSLPIASER
jgi:hypothetical protein